MENNIYTRPGIHFFTFLDTINCHLKLTRYANQNDRWTASIEMSEIKKGGILEGTYGTGKTPESAIKDYVLQIKKQRLVINATTENRTEYTIPDNIFFD